KLMLDRAEEITAGGNRPSAYGKVRIAGTKDGKITAYDVDCYGTPGVGTSRTTGPLLYVYSIPNTKVKVTVARRNTGQSRAMRAPGHPQSCILTDCPLDDLAAKLELDPMQMRLKNLPPKLPQAGGNDQHALKVYADEIAIAAKLSDWQQKWHPP